MSGEVQVIEGTVLDRRPAIDTIEPQMLKLIKATVASDQGITDAEIAYFLELASVYQLDPFAREVWIAKSKSGKLLIMVGRDGLRRIARRNGVHVDSDVVHANDEFSVTRSPDGNRSVQHVWSVKDRGEIVGAWAECREGGQMGRPLGFFYAPLDEFKPKDLTSFSPWSKQVSAMITGAAERQAIRKATPLGGLLVDGEQHAIEQSSVAQLGRGEGDGSEPGWQDLTPHQILLAEGVIAEADRVGYAPLMSAARASLQMKLGGQDTDTVDNRIMDWQDELEKFKGEAV